MTFTFLHTSDWHLGKPFGRFDQQLAGVLRQSRLTVCDRLAEAARKGRAGHVLVAGDIYDRPGLSDRELRAPLLQLDAHADLTWHLIPGNHDAATPGGIWDRILRIGLPPNVVVHLEAKPALIADAVWLLPAPLAARSVAHDPTAWMDAAATPDGATRLGLAHGSILGFGSEHRASVEIAPDRPRRAGLAYLALGDWHGARTIGPHAAYSGTPEPDGFLDNGPGNALLVTLDGPARPPRIERLRTGEHIWLQRSISTARFSDLADLEGEIEGLGAQARRVLLSLEISGRLAMSQEQTTRQRLDRLEARVLYLDRKLDQLVPAPAADDIERLPEGGLRHMAQDLAACAADADHAQQKVAARALRHLFELSQDVMSPDSGVTP